MQKPTSPIKKTALKFALVQGFATALALVLGIVLWLMGCFIEMSFIEFGVGLRLTTVLVLISTTGLSWTWVSDNRYKLDKIYESLFDKD